MLVPSSAVESMGMGGLLGARRCVSRRDERRRQRVVQTLTLDACPYPISPALS